MTQLEIYKVALRVMDNAKFEKEVHPWWQANINLSINGTTLDKGICFSGLCCLVWGIIIASGSEESVKMELRFIEDSEKVLGNGFNDSKYWFTDMEEDEPKARAERIEHLKKLIKLYEDEEE